VSINPVIACDKPKTWKNKVGAIASGAAMVVFGVPIYILMLPINTMIIASYNAASKETNKPKDIEQVDPTPCSDGLDE